jgi:hypothetical protein
MLRLIHWVQVCRLGVRALVCAEKGLAGLKGVVYTCMQGLVRIAARCKVVQRPAGLAEGPCIEEITVHASVVAAGSAHCRQVASGCSTQRRLHLWIPCLKFAH